MGERGAAGVGQLSGAGVGGRLTKWQRAPCCDAAGGAQGWGARAQLVGRLLAALAVSAICLHQPQPPRLHPPPQERADDEHTTRGMRLVQAEADAISKGWPLGDGIGLFGVGSSRNGLPGAGGASAKARGGGALPPAEQSVELNASASGGARGGGDSPLRAPSRAPLFGGGASSSGGGGGGGGAAGPSEAPRGSPPSKADAIREKYGLQGRGGAAGATTSTSAAAAAAPWEVEPEEGAVDALFAGVEARPARQAAGAQRLLDQPADSSGGSYSFGWKRGR